MFGRGFRIATIRGVPVNVDSSWIWIAVLLVATFWFRVDAEFPELSSATALAFALFGALVFFGSVFLHESAHAVTARLAGIEVHSITLVFFGGFTAARADEKGPRARVRDRGIRTRDEPRPVGRVLAPLPLDREHHRSPPGHLRLRRACEPVHGGLQRAPRAAARRRPDARGGRVALVPEPRESDARGRPCRHGGRRSRARRRDPRGHTPGPLRRDLARHHRAVHPAGSPRFRAADRLGCAAGVGDRRRGDGSAAAGGPRRHDAVADARPVPARPRGRGVPGDRRRAGDRDDLVQLRARARGSRPVAAGARRRDPRSSTCWSRDPTSRSTRCPPDWAPNARRSCCAKGSSSARSRGAASTAGRPARPEARSPLGRVVGRG